jgi:hypothetical protein
VGAFRGLRRKPGGPLTPEFLALFVLDWRALAEDHGKGRMTELEKRWGVWRAQLWRWLDEAEKQGLIRPDERDRRNI